MESESQNIEFKESWRDEYLKWICGFANAQGGTLYIGINDNGEVCGINDAKKLMEDIPNKVRDLMGIIVDVNLKQKEEKQYIEIIIEAYPYPISYKGQYHFRSGSTKQELKGAALDRFLLRKQGKTWDSVPLPFLKIEDLDTKTIDSFRKFAQKSGRMNDADLKDNNHDLLEKLRLYDGNYLKRAAALLFHPDPEKYVTGASIKIGYFKTDDNLIYQDEIHGNLFLQVDNLISILTTKYLKASIRYEDIQRIEELPVPRAALREACMNAIVHKDYASSTPIQISVYDDKLMIWNCGVLPENWSIETLMSKHGSRPFNPDIANVFFRAGEIEAWGRGVERINSACKEAGCKEPTFKYDGFGLWTIFEFESATQKTENTTQKDKETLPKRAENATQKTENTAQKDKKLTNVQKAIIDYIIEHPKATRKEIAEHIPNITEDGIKYNLGRLQKTGMIKRIGGRKLGYWEVLNLSSHISK